MTGQLLTAGFYLLLALAATVVNLRRRTWIAGVALVAYTLISSATFFLVDFEWRVLREIGLATAMAILAFELWCVGDAPQANRTVMALCAFDVAFCGVISVKSDPSPLAQLMFAYGVNAIFVGMCIAVAAPGVQDAVRRWFPDVDDLRSPDREAAPVDISRQGEGGGPR